MKLTVPGTCCPSVLCCAWVSVVCKKMFGWRAPRRIFVGVAVIVVVRTSYEYRRLKLFCCLNGAGRVTHAFFVGVGQ